MEQQPGERLSRERILTQAEVFAARRRARRLDAGGDVADRASRAVDMATALALYQLFREKLEQTERARARMLAGLYGTCESCGEPIGPDRLEAAPYATRCVSCQRRRER